MKRFLPAMMLVAALVTSLSASADIRQSEYQAIVNGSTPVEGIRYQFDEASLTATVATIDSLMPDSIMHIPETVAYEGKTYTVTAIGAHAFGYGGNPFKSSDKPWVKLLQGLKRIYVPKTVTTIGEGAFNNTTWRGNTIPSSKYSILSPLDGVYFEEESQLQTVGANAFGQRTKSTSSPKALVTKIVFAEGLKTIGPEWFMDCENLREVVVPASVESIGEKAFSQSHYHYYMNDDGEVSYDKPFYVVILEGSNLHEIGQNAFSGYVCIGSDDGQEMTSRLIRDGQVLPRALQGNKYHTSFYIPEMVTAIGDYAFQNSSVKTISCDALVPPIVGAEAFSAGLSVSVPFTSYEAYSDVDVWKDYLSSQWTVEEGGVNYTLTWPDQVKIDSWTGEGVSLENQYWFQTLVLQDSVSYCGKRFAVQPEIPEGLLFNQQYASSYGKPSASYANNYIERLVIKTPVDSLPRLFLPEENTSFVTSWNALKEVILPPALKEIGNDAFRGLNKAVGRIWTDRGSYYATEGISIVIPENVERIGDKAFYGVPLTEVSLPEGVKQVGDQAFYNHLGREITVPASLEQIGEDAFYTEATDYSYEPYAVDRITVADGNQHFQMDGEALITADHRRMLLATTALTGDYSFPEGMQQVDPHAMTCSSPVNIHIPASLTMPGLITLVPNQHLKGISVADANPVYRSIDGVLFNHAADSLLRYPPCRGLSEYTVPTSVTVLGEHAMEDAHLKTVNLPVTLRELGDYSLAGNDMVEFATPDSVQILGAMSLGRCEYLRSFTMPKALKQIRYLNVWDGYPLGDCPNLHFIYSDDKPISASRLRDFIRGEEFIGVNNKLYLFLSREGYDSLMVLRDTYKGNYNPYLQEEYDHAHVVLVCEDDYAEIEGVGYHRVSDGEATVLNATPRVKAETSVPTTVTIGTEQCVVNKVAIEAFQSNEQLTSLYLPASIDTIGYGEDGYTVAQEIATGNGVKLYYSRVVCDRAFSGMKNLKTLTLDKASRHRTIDEEMFSGCPRLERITLPDGIDTLGIAAFSGDSALIQLDFTFTPTLRKIPPMSFKGCASLTNFNVPDSVTTIGLSAFEGCKSLRYLNMPRVTDIGNLAFAFCEALDSITLTSAQSGYYSFYGCKNLVKLPRVNIRKGDYNDNINLNPFEGCMKLTDYPEWLGNRQTPLYTTPTADLYFYTKDGLLVTEWRRVDEEREDNPKLTLLSYPLGRTERDFVVPDDVGYIGNGAFAHSQLESVTLPASVANIAYGAFAFNHQLKTITLKSEIPPYCRFGEDAPLNESDYLLHFESFISNYSQYVEEDGYLVYKKIPTYDVVSYYGSHFDADVMENATLIVPASAIDIYRESFWGMYFKNIHADDEVTAIQDVKAFRSAASDGIYDLQGRKVNNNGGTRKGFYIVDGRKVVR